MLDSILKPIGWVMRQCYELTNHYAIALLLFSLFIQILLLPLGIKQQKNTIRQAMLRPKVLAIQKKYKGRTDKATQLKMQQEIQDMYQNEGYNQLGGCLPLLIQLPIILILYQVILKPLTYLIVGGADVTPIITAKYIEVNDLVAGTAVQESALLKFIIDRGWGAAEKMGIAQSIYESIASLENGFSFFGGTSLLSSPSMKSFNWLLLIPVFVYVSSLGSSLIAQKFNAMSQDEQNTPMTGPLMKYGMPLIGVIFSFQLSAAIGLYWIYRSVLSILQTIILNKVMPIPQITQEQIALAEAALKKKKKKKKVLLIEVDEDDDSYDDMVVSEERAAKIKAKNERLAREEQEEDKQLAALAKKAEEEQNGKKGGSYNGNDEEDK